jgi:phosphatidate cytidylyltransferase
MALGNLAQRALVAMVAVPIVLAVVVGVDHHAPTWALIFGATLLAMREYFGMTMPDARDRTAALACGGLACAALYWLNPIALETTSAESVVLFAAGPIAAMVLAVIAPALYFLFRFGEMTTTSARLAAAITGIVYAGVMLTFLALPKRDFGAHGGDVVILILLVAWIGDTGAYFAGRFLGKTKLYPAVSPKKTWAGAIGGLAGSFAAVAVAKLTRLEQLAWIDVALIAIPGGILGQLGDLVESLIKRSVGVKDSGTLLPGHGGMLDRIDAVLFIAPYTYLYLTLRPLV